jgi:hypothetical protein
MVGIYPNVLPTLPRNLGITEHYRRRVRRYFSWAAFAACADSTQRAS